MNELKENLTSRRAFLTQITAASVVAMASARVVQAVGEEATGAPKAHLKTCKIPQTDLVVSRIAYGCALVGSDWNGADFIPKLIRVFNAAYDSGVTFFDTADIYGFGRSETAIGQVLRQTPGLRNTVVLQSKCGDHMDKSESLDSSREHIISAVEGSLQRLGIDTLDVLLLHWPDALVEPEGVAEAFDHLERSGKVRYFGVSNHNIGQIELLKKFVRQPLVANQIRLGLGNSYPIADTRDYLGAPGIVDYCRIQDIQVQAYSPLRGDLLIPPADASPKVKELAQKLAELAEEKKTNTSAVALAWLLRHPAGIVPILGASKPEHVVQNCAADAVTLSREEWYSLFRSAESLQWQKAS
jgi:predicted oxidoreductase